jgi:hypothetical protein
LRTVPRPKLCVFQTNSPSGMSSYSYVPCRDATGLGSARNEPGTFLSQHPLERLPIKIQGKTRKAAPAVSPRAARAVLKGPAVQYCGDTAFTGGGSGFGSDGMRTSLPNAGPEGDRRFTPNRRTREANRFFGESNLGKKSVANCRTTGVSECV